jgi:hypothetical protein
VDKLYVWDALQIQRPKAQEPRDEMNVNQSSAQKARVYTVDFVYLWAMEFNVSVQLDFQENVVKLT